MTYFFGEYGVKKAGTDHSAACIRIVLADDHKLTRTGVRELLDLCHDMEVVGEATDGSVAVHMVESSHPDVVVMDISMPNLNGIDATELIHHHWPEVKILALSTHADRMHVQAMLKAGASGFIVKESLFEDLPIGIREVAHGKSYFSRRVRQFEFLPPIDH